VELNGFEKEFILAEKKVIHGLKQAFKKVRLAEHGKI
jgi:hypothetical protein